MLIYPTVKMSPLLGLLGGGGGVAGAGTAGPGGVTTIEALNSKMSWTVMKNGGNYDTDFNSSDYYGKRCAFHNSDGSVRHNDYEYFIGSKFYCRSNTAHTAVFQMYDTNSTQSNFTNFTGGGSNEPGNLWGMGLAWSQSATDMHQTNSIYARSELSSGNGAYFITNGTGSTTWSMYDGGANSNAQGQSSTNREDTESVNWAWANKQITFILYGNGTNSSYQNKIRLFCGDTLVHQFTSSPGTSHANVWMFSMYMYPNGKDSLFDDVDLKMRYSNTADTDIDI